VTIEKLHVMPTHTKGDGGYFYDHKYVNKLFQFENKLVYFTESSFQEWPLELYNIVVKDVKHEIDNLVENIDKFSVVISEKVEEIKTDLENKIKKLAVTTASIKTEIEELKVELNSNSKLISSLNNIDESTINTMIDKKLQAVYNSFEKLSEKFVKDNMDNALKDSKREASGKLKIASLAIFKELGYSPAEIKDLAESGLI